LKGGINMPKMDRNKAVEIKKARFYKAIKKGDLRHQRSQLNQVYDLVCKKGLEDRLMETLIRIKRA